MLLNDLLKVRGIDPEQVLVLRHRPHELKLRKVLPWLAAERPELFNAYQQTQGEKLEAAIEAMKGRGFVASFLGHEPGKALFVGFYSIAGSKSLTHKQFWDEPSVRTLEQFGMRGWTGEDVNRSVIRWFDLILHDFYREWKGKLTIQWPPPERSWWRRAHRNQMQVLSILEESAFDSSMPEWDTIDFTWEELAVLPSRWKLTLSQWRAIYYIFDSSDGKGYVGSAYGKENLLGRWLNYAAAGHGGNKLLRKREPKHFRFSILQRVSPDMDADDVIRLEATWKKRLHSRTPHGLNEN